MCSSFQISVCMFIVSKALLISSATVIVRAEGGALLNPFVVFCDRVAWVCLVCLLLCKEECSSPLSFQLLRRWAWDCMRYPCLCLCWVLGWVLC